jgi:hypothetical protein
MAMRDDFAAVILTHGRADNVKTYRALRESGYSGRILIVIDDEDKQAPLYERNFPGLVRVFCKSEWAGKIDDGDNSGDTRAVVYARAACVDVAKAEGLKWIVQLDDDYSAFYYKNDDQNRYCSKRIGDLDAVWSAMVAFAERGNVACLAMSQEGDHIGGQNSNYNKTIRTKRKAMNSMFMRVDDPVSFVGKVNEDATMATLEGLRGRLVLTLMGVSLSQGVTQQNAGGLTDIYKAQGTYVKSMYSVLYAPSCVRVKNMVVGEKRLHHIVDYSKCAPQIIRETHRKPRVEKSEAA